MSCSNCQTIKAGRLVRVKKDNGRWLCDDCGRDMSMNLDYHGEKQKRWDKYFHSICVAVATKSPCLSRQIGAILVRDRSIVSTGFNGPARGYPHCEEICPRKSIPGYESGKFLDQCPATHAESNCVTNAARVGASTVGTTLYMNCIIPCKDCMALLVNAGVKEVVVDDIKPYHEISVDIAVKGGISIRRFRQ